jgi:hypothetical protein
MDLSTQFFLGIYSTAIIAVLRYFSSQQKIELAKHEAKLFQIMDENKEQTKHLIKNERELILNTFQNSITQQISPMQKDLAEIRLLLFSKLSNED